MDQTVIFFLAAVILVGALILTLICSNKKGRKYLNVEYYRAKCLEIEHQLKRDEFSSYHLSIINADKLLDKALTDRGFSGKTMGERMKNASKTFSDQNGIWSAHKLRNKIAHESDVYVTYDQARSALANFRKALKDVGAI
jgi:hypothetical protein